MVPVALTDFASSGMVLLVGAINGLWGYKCVLQAKLGGVCHVCHVSQHNKTRSYIISFHILSKVKSRIWCKKKKITYMVSHKTLVNAYLVV